MSRYPAALLLVATLLARPACGSDDPLDEIVARYRSHGSPVLARVNEHLLAGRWSEAESILRGFLGSAEGTRDGHLGLGYVLAHGDHFSQACQELDQFAHLDSPADDLILCAEIFEDLGEAGGQRSQECAQTYLVRALARAFVESDSDPTSFAKLRRAALLGLHADRPDDFGRATAVMERDFPEQADTHLFLGIRHAQQARWLAAEQELDRAVELGTPAIVAQELLDATGIPDRARPWRIARWAGFAGLSLGACLLALLILAKLLSFWTLRSAESADPRAPISAMQSLLRRSYRWIIHLAGVYYYVALPFVIVLSISVMILLGYVFLGVGAILIKAWYLLIMLMGATFVMIKSSIQSLFTRVETPTPGEILPEAEAPGLWALTREVAADVGTRPIDEIRLTEDTELAVLERGSWREKRKDRARRVLILGTGLIEGFRLDAFRAVLAHEYGHFLHRDTAGGDVALRINTNIREFALGMARGGTLTWWNIGWQFVRFYHHVFLLITHGASRLQEIHADRVAAGIWGQEAFEQGLRHSVWRSIVENRELQLQADEEHRRWISRAAEEQEEREEGEEADEEPWSARYDRVVERHRRETEFRLNWERSTEEDDTHPSPIERIRLLERLDSHSATRIEEGRREPIAVLEDLFPDFEQRNEARLERRHEKVTEVLSESFAEWRESIAVLGEYLDENPTLAVPRLERGVLRLRLGDLAGADADFTEAIRLDGPHPSRPFRCRGQMRFQQEEFEGAIADLIQALKLDEDDQEAGIRLELGDAFWRAGKTVEAISEYDDVIELEPDHLGALLRRADARHSLEDLEGARSDYERVLILLPDCPEAMDRLATLTGR